MKNQYFGDVYDYVKYGLLRRLSNYGESGTALCWMMTLDDERSDGGRYTGYLRDPEGWRECDPPVWDFLCSQVLGKQKRSTKAVEKRKDFLPNHELLLSPDSRRPRGASGVLRQVPQGRQR